MFTVNILFDCASRRHPKRQQHHSPDTVHTYHMPHTPHAARHTHNTPHTAHRIPPGANATSYWLGQFSPAVTSADDVRMTTSPQSRAGTSSEGTPPYTMLVLSYSPAAPAPLHCTPPTRWCFALQDAGGPTLCGTALASLILSLRVFPRSLFGCLVV